jgi:hypothetical protein
VLAVGWVLFNKGARQGVVGLFSRDPSPRAVKITE